MLASLPRTLEIPHLSDVGVDLPPILMLPLPVLNIVAYPKPRVNSQGVPKAEALVGLLLGLFVNFHIRMLVSTKAILCFVLTVPLLVLP